MNSPLLQQAVEVLTRDIMNLPCPGGVDDGSAHEMRYAGYRDGHRDARHAAVELVNAAFATIQQQPEAVARKPGWEFNDGWQFFVGYMIDHCARETVSEEALGRWAAAFLRDPKYNGTAPPALQQQEGKGEAVADRLLRGLVNHWNEFGPEHGLDEKMDAAHRYRAPSPSTAVQQEAGSGWSREDAAMQQITEARMRLAAAIESYEAADYGSHVTQPLRDAFALVEFSIKEVTS